MHTSIKASFGRPCLGGQGCLHISMEIRRRLGGSPAQYVHRFCNDLGTVFGKLFGHRSLIEIHFLLGFVRWPFSSLFLDRDFDTLGALADFYR